jgi:hypothetical protein
LLYTLNRKGALDYVSKFDMPKPTDDIDAVLQAVGTRFKFQLSRKAAQEKGLPSPGEGDHRPAVDVERAAVAMVRMFRYARMYSFMCLHKVIYNTLRACGAHGRPPFFF